MNFRIPIYVEEERAADAPTPGFVVRPLFFVEPASRGERLNRALTRLASDLRKTLYALAAEPDHGPLADWTFSPALDETWLETRLELKRGNVACRLLVVSFEALDRRIAFAPHVPEVVFEILRGQDIKQRAAEVFSRHFRDQEREAEEALPESAFAISGKAWLTILELSVAIPTEVKVKPTSSLFAMLGGGETLSGAQELERVGRCLNFLYPDDLDRAVLRDREVDELHTLLISKDRRPVLIVGPRQVGKTAIVHEVVWRLVDARQQKFAGRNNVWLLSPARLISGMSYVGQWENRLLAILKEVHERNHVLYFDDLPGLFFAGQSCASNLSVADVLKPRLEKRECRVVAEITPEALRVLRERDRSFVDLFHIVPVHEPAERETTRILIAVQRQLEEQHECQFDLETVPLVRDVQRRYAPDLAFPGKAAGFLRQLAVKFRARDVNRADVLGEFQAKTGLLLPLLDSRSRLMRDQIVRGLRSQIIGQHVAVETMADAVSLAAARLNDPSRPLASLLFLGPTGVGKTQCAKALAKFLFGDASRLVRFDMNEFLSADSAARLIGTLAEPEGLLTSAVRRQPFCVLLLDEIEKAHPDVFDLLLAVLGEGRLTDALGRTANFTNAIIVLTSNLGAREVRSRLGFHATLEGEVSRAPISRNREAVRDAQGSSLQSGNADAALYIEAAEKFFRPEFFNRLDRVVPFTSLSIAEIERIANQVIGDVFNRDGLRQRQCMLHVDRAAMSSLVERGYHPALGARALKRVVERELAQPVAMRLAELPPGTPAVVRLRAASGKTSVSVSMLEQAKPAGVSTLDLAALHREDVLDAIEAALTRIESGLEAHAPDGRVELGKVSRQQARYFAVSEQVRFVRRLLQRLTADERRRHSTTARVGRPRVPSHRTLVRFTAAPIYKQQVAADQFRASLHELHTEPLGDENAVRLLDCVHELALADVMANAPEPKSRALLRLTMFDPSAMWAISRSLRESMQQMFEKFWGFEVKAVAPTDEMEEFGRERVFCLELNGPAAQIIAGVETGTHLFLPQTGNMVLTHVTVTPLDGEEPVASVSLADEFAPLTRISEEGGRTADLRSGLAVSGEPGAEELRTFFLSQLPVPAEFDALLRKGRQ